jgi:hypothetical protein
MRKFKHVMIALAIASITAVGCGGPNDDKGSMNNEQPGEEQQIDSSRMISSDSTNNTGTRSDGD